MKLALYEVHPGDKWGHKYGQVIIGRDSTSISMFSPDVKGLNEAIKIAKTKNARVVKIEEEYTNADDLIAEVRRLVKNGHGIKLFMPAIGIERELIKGSKNKPTGKVKCQAE